MALASRLLASGSGWRSRKISAASARRSPVRGMAPRGLHRGGDGGDVPLPLDARVGRAGAGRAAPRQRPALLRMRPRARGRRPLSVVSIHARISARRRRRRPGRAPLGFHRSAPAAAPGLAADRRRRRGRARGRRRRRIRGIGDAACRRGFRGVG